MQKAAAYIRVSTGKQEISMEAQEQRIRAYCTMAGLDLVAVFTEEGVSASKPIDTRPQGRQLISVLQSGEVQHVVALKLDRLFRDAVDCLTRVREWDAVGVALHLVDMGGQTINTGSAMGRMFLTMMAGFAEFERALISERTSQALQHLKEKGVRLGQAPLESEAVDRAQQLYAEGRTLRQIAEVLTAEGYATKRGGSWAPSNVRLLIQRSAA